MHLPFELGDFELSYEMSEDAFRKAVSCERQKTNPADFKYHLNNWIGTYHRLNEDFLESILDSLDSFQAEELYKRSRRESSRVFLRMRWGFE